MIKNDCVPTESHCVPGLSETTASRVPRSKGDADTVTLMAPEIPSTASPVESQEHSLSALVLGLCYDAALELIPDGSDGPPTSADMAIAITAGLLAIADAIDRLGARK
jgi:hypothetical protein